MRITVAEIRQRVEAAKLVAMDKFERDWGTRDVYAVVAALKKTIPGSASPADAAAQARKMLGDSHATP